MLKIIFNGSIPRLFSNLGSGNIAVLVVMMVTSALFDALGVASLLPFISVVTDPQKTYTNPILFAVYQSFGFHNSDSFLVFLGTLVFFTILVSLLFKILSNYTQVRAVCKLEHSSCLHLLRVYLQRPYEWHLDNHSANLHSQILSEVSNVIRGIVLPTLTIIAQATVVIAILGLLIMVNTHLAIVTGLVISASYFLIFRSLKSYVAKIGASRLKANLDRFMVLSEAFGAIKEIKARGLESIHVQNFIRPSEINASQQMRADIVGRIPRYLLEAVAFGGLLASMLYLMLSNGGSDSAIPVIALYAFGGYKLLPAFQQIYQSATLINYTNPALSKILIDLMDVSKPESARDYCEGLICKEGIELKGVWYRYPNADSSAIQGVDLSIKANSSVGIVGSTGSGKTTLVDLLLGLLAPQAGSLCVDGVEITPSNLFRWQAMIGYAPQNIYLSDATILENIAFGVSQDLIDMEAVEIASKIACIHDFIINELPDGYSSKVGERGVRLSGGQRQRLGIARALYHRPAILILDESTSALDGLTEISVTKGIKSIYPPITLIIISHRLGLIKDCDRIYFISDGVVESSGSFHEVMNENKDFRAMVNIK